MNVAKILVLVISIGWLSSCAKTITTIKNDVDLNLDSETGYLLMGVDISYDLNQILISGEQLVALSSKDLRKGSSYFLVEMPAGDYRFSSIKFTQWFKLKFNQDLWKFKVSPGVISYVGHLELKTPGFAFFNPRLELENRSSQALKFLESDFPNILAKRKVVYLGPGQDQFFEKVQNMAFAEEVL